MAILHGSIIFFEWPCSVGFEARHVGDDVARNKCASVSLSGWRPQDVSERFWHHAPSLARGDVRSCNVLSMLCERMFVDSVIICLIFEQTSTYVYVNSSPMWRTFSRLVGARQPTQARRLHAQADDPSFVVVGCPTSATR